MRITVASGIFLLLFIHSGYCGVIKNDAQHEAIFGGQFANIHEAPYHVMLVFNGNYVCGGALITYKHVLTAGHCLREKANNPHAVLQVVAGTDNQDVRGEVRYASSVYIHPRYGGREFSFDVGIIVLDQPFPHTQMISTVSLPKNWAHAGEDVRITGFGMFNRYSDLVSRKLKKYYSEIIDCYRYIGPELAKPGDLCTRSSQGQGICFGDSGSPLVNSKGQIVGVASRVFGCGDGTPNVYSNIYYYMRYINAIVSQTGGSTHSNDNNEKKNNMKYQQKNPSNWWDDDNENWDQYNPQTHENSPVPKNQNGEHNNHGWWDDDNKNWDQYDAPQTHENSPVPKNQNGEHNNHGWWDDDNENWDQYDAPQDHEDLVVPRNENSKHNNHGWWDDNNENWDQYNPPQTHENSPVPKNQNSEHNNHGWWDDNNENWGQYDTPQGHENSVEPKYENNVDKNQNDHQANGNKWSVLEEDSEWKPMNPIRYRQ